MSAQGNVEALQSCFSDIFHHYPDFYNERRTGDSTTAIRVFDIPELLELILENLDVLDLLSFYRCNRSIRDAIDASSKLQQQLSLRAAPADSRLRLPLRNFSRFSSGIPRDDERGLFATPIVQIGFSSYEHIGRGFPHSNLGQEMPEKEDRTAEIHALFHLRPSQALPRVGSRIRQMLITQPPINQMIVSTDCCPSYDYSISSEPRPLFPMVENLNGVTVGDLYDCTEKLLNEHRLCTSAHSALLDDDGNVQVGVSFVGMKNLYDDDPIYTDWKRQQRSIERKDRKRQRRAAKFEAYCNAKRNGERPTPFMLSIADAE